MMSARKVILPLAATLLLAAGSARAVNITINDNITGSGSWYGSTANASVGREDNEVEPGCVQSQVWDLEGFYLDGSTLSMVGGYNFAGGQDGVASGDIFLDVNGNAVYGVDNFAASGNGYYNVNNQWGYDYAVDLNFATSTYTVYAIDADTLVTAYYRQNDASNPWQYSAGGDVYASGAFTYTAGLASYDGLTGGTHNVVSLDLANFLTPGTEFTSHFTMGCGNDNLMGNGTTPVPEPGTLILLGCGLVGLAAVRRRKRA